LPAVKLGACLAATLALALHAAPAQAQQPNIVVVMSDDQAYGTEGEMPYVSSLPGLEPFGTLYANTALCCPARATFLSGQYSHHTGVSLNRHGERFDDRQTLATWLDDAGYETGLFGKYLNTYPFHRGGDYIPPGWDRWVAFADRGDPRYYSYELSFDGVEIRMDGDADAYSTDVLARHAETFVENAPEPFFAYVAPAAPHYPYLGAPRHLGLYDDVPFPVRSNFNRHARGAPAYYRRAPAAREDEQAEIWRGQMEALQALDELVEGVVSAADARGPTVVLYLSDNGYSLGSHGIPLKRCGYEECGRVPGLIRSPGDPSGVLASNADLAPTLAELAGARPGPTDGRSLLPAMTGEPQQRPAVLLHNASNHEGRDFGKDLPAFWGVRTPRWKYLEHSRAAGTPRRELYDLEADPYELENLAGSPEARDVLEDLDRRLRRLRAARPSR
jgi:arylsulfatase A-like enzyme